jgi:hypothetical protein
VGGWVVLGEEGWGRMQCFLFRAPLVLCSLVNLRACQPLACHP